MDPDAAKAQRSSPFSEALPLVGRNDELAFLQNFMEAPDHRHVAVLLGGEGGVGKSRLSEELGARAERKGWTVARGRAYPVETGVPYALFSDAFLPLLRSLDDDTLTVLSRGGQAELKYLFPALASEAVAAPSDAGADPDEFRTRLLWNFAEFLKSLAARKPLLVILEDLQWADESSLQLLHFVARQAAGHPIFILGTYADTERGRIPHITQMERSLVSLHAGEVRHLEPLEATDVTELICKLFGVDEGLVAEFSGLLFEWTRGNPFFVEAVLKSLVSSGRIHQQEDTWIGWDATDFALPESVREAVLERIAGFPEDTRHVAEMAAVVGARASYPILLALGDLDEERLLTALEQLCDEGVLREQAADGAVVYHFVHPLVRQTLYGEFSLQRVRILHGAVAEAMEAYWGDAATDHAGELAFHYSRTDSARLGGKATRYLAAAGHAALERHADREAVKYLTAALEQWQSDDGSLPRDKLLGDLARAHTRLGHYAEALPLLQELVAGLPDDTARLPQMLGTLGLTHFWAGDHLAAVAELERGLEVALGSGNAASVVQARLVRGHCFQEMGRGEDARKEVEGALEAAQSLGDTAVLARVHRSLTLLYVWVGPPAKAVEHAELAISLAKEAGDSSAEFWARWGLAVLSGMRGDTGGMAAQVAEIEVLADKLRSPVLRLWATELSVEMAYASGQWDQGITLGEQAIALARDLNQQRLLPRLLVWTSLFYLGRGNLERAKALVDEAGDTSGIHQEDGPLDVHLVVPAYIGLAHYLVGTGDYAPAAEAAEKGLRIAEGTGYTLWAVHRLLPILAEASLWAGEIDDAEALGQRLQEYSETMDHRLGLAWAKACRALVCWKRGDPERGAILMREAAEDLETIPMIPYAARIRRQLAGRLADIGDTEGALEELRAVHGTFLELGAELELEKARIQFREMGQRPPPRRSGQGVAGLTARELEIARLVSRRKSNKAIGKELGISPRTASTHLSNIFQKLEITSRGELADLVREMGLND